MCARGRSPNAFQLIDPPGRTRIIYIRGDNMPRGSRTFKYAAPVQY